METTFNEVKKVFENIIEMEVGNHEKIIDLDIDSLIMIELRNRIEFEYKVDLKLNQLVTMTVGEAIEFVIKQAENSNSGSDLYQQIEREEKREFALNDLQKAYWVGRSNEYELGNVSTHVYVEFDSNSIDASRLEKALNKVIERQEMMRVIILKSGLQKILPVEEAEYSLPYKDISMRSEEEIRAILENERNRMSHEIFEMDKWPFFAMRVYKTASDSYRIYFSIDMFIADACSLQIFFTDLQKYYEGNGKELKNIEFHFKDYIKNDLKIENTEKYRESDRYWEEKTKKMPLAPHLPTIKQPSEIDRPIFKHLSKDISASDYKRLKAKAKQYNVTIPAILLTVYAKVLSIWSQEKSFSINVTNLDRRMYHESVKDLIGQFASFTIFTADFENEKKFFEEVATFQEGLWNDLDNRYIGGTKILQKMRINNENVEGAIMPVVFTCILEDMSQAEWIGDIVYSVSQTSQIWLDNQTLERNGMLVLSWDYLEELFPHNMVEEMMEAYEYCLINLARQEEQWQSFNVEILPEKLFVSRNKRNETANDNIPMPVELLENAFISYGNNICIVSDETKLTYTDVDTYSDRIRNYLSHIGNEKNVVAIVMKKGWEQVVSAVGIVRSGAAYLPIDAALPKERIEYMLENCSVQHIFTDDETYEDILYLHENYKLEKLTSIINTNQPEQSVVNQPKENDLLYVIYTSGSTGNPTGVMVQHQGVGNAIYATNNKFKVNENDAVIAMTPFHHDMSIYDTFGILSVGGKLVIPNEQTRKDPAKLSQLLLDEQVTVWNSVPALMDVFVDYIKNMPAKIPTFLRLVFLGGDWISINTCKELFDIVSRLCIVSVGGPTETTLWNIWYPFTKIEENWKKIPYGYPINNTKYYIVDDKFNSLPNWVSGNICSSGVGVSLGYCNDEEKTNERFVINPNTGERTFISGDVGRYLEDGSIEINGRKDYQIKINGVRIELEEIENALLQYAGVKQAVVLLDEIDKKKLTGYITMENDEYSEADILSYMNKKVPNYMVPKEIILVDAMPENANHKLNRKALKTYKKKRCCTDKKTQVNKVVTNEKVSETIANIVKEVLLLEELDYDANLASVGASSIELIKIINQLEKVYHHRMALEDVFNNLTINKLAQYFQERVSGLNTEKDETIQNQDESNDLINSYSVLFDRSQREMFKMSNNGLRRDLGDKKIVTLDKNESEDMYEEVRKRRSFRRYNQTQIKFKDFSNFLFNLSNVDEEKYPNFMYASGGGLYSIQVYVYVKKDAIENLESGIYYYDRNSHMLKLLSDNIEVGEEIHWSSNKKIYEESAFSIYLVSDYDAVGPMYGDQGVHFITIEAGLVSQLLEMKAPEYNIGLCQIGNMDFDKIKPYLDLKESHIFMHTILGGYIDFEEDFESIQNSLDYMEYEYTGGNQNSDKDVINAINVSDLAKLAD